jgi:hypothetical protein
MVLACQSSSYIAYCLLNHSYFPQEKCNTFLIIKEVLLACTPRMKYQSEPYLFEGMVCELFQGELLNHDLSVKFFLVFGMDTSFTSPQFLKTLKEPNTLETAVSM